MSSFKIAGGVARRRSVGVGSSGWRGVELLTIADGRDGEEGPSGAITEKGVVDRAFRVGEAR